MSDARSSTHRSSSSTSYVAMGGTRAVSVKTRKCAFSQVEGANFRGLSDIALFLPSCPVPSIPTSADADAAVAAAAASKVFISVRELAALSDILPDNVS